MHDEDFFLVLLKNIYHKNSTQSCERLCIVSIVRKCCCILPHRNVAFVDITFENISILYQWVYQCNAPKLKLPEAQNMPSKRVS